MRTSPNAPRLLDSDTHCSAVIVVGVLVLIGIGVAVFFLVRHLAAKSGSSGYSASTRQNWAMEEMYSTSPATL